MDYDLAPVQAADSQLGLLLASLQDSTREWREELGEVSSEAIRWQAFEDGHSIGGVLLHMADAEEYWIQEFLAGRQRTEERKRQLMSEDTDQYASRWPKPPDEPLSYFYKILDEVRAQTLSTAAKFLEPDRVYPRGHESFTIRWVISHIVQHDSYHGGQVVLLKAMWDRLGH